MFGIHLRQLYRTCDKVIIRNLRSRRLDTRNPNPGLDNQIKAFEADGLRVKEENLEEFVEQSESDFYNVSAFKFHLVHKHHKVMSYPAFIWLGRIKRGTQFKFKTSVSLYPKGSLTI